MSNEQSKVVTKVIDVRHKAPDQAIHELMQAAKDGFAVTKIATRFNHTHVYLEASTKQVSETTTKAVGESTKAEETVEGASKESEKAEVKTETVKVEPVKPVAKKTTAKSTATADKANTAKKVEQGDKDVE